MTRLRRLPFFACGLATLLVLGAAGSDDADDGSPNGPADSADSGEDAGSTSNNAVHTTPVSVQPSQRVTCPTEPSVSAPTAASPMWTVTEPGETR